MHQGRFVFAQLMEHMPLDAFRAAVRRYRGQRYVKRFSCLDQFLCMAFAQLTGRESLRDIELCLRAHQAKLYHLGIRGHVARSTLADANEKRDWRIFADLAQHLIRQALPLYADTPLAGDFAQAAYALDSTTIEVCLSAFPWARAPHAGHGGIKLHTLLDVRSSIPTVIHLTPSRSHDVHMLDRLTPERGALYLMDRAYLDFERLYAWHCQGAFFVMRAKRNLRVSRRYSHPVANRDLVRSDQTVVLTRDVAREKYPLPLRKLRLRDAETGEHIVLLTNQFSLSGEAVGQLYRDRWRIEVFFRWIKQHLRIKAFYGRTTNAVLVQVWIAVSVYVLIAILKKRLDLTASLYEILQILGITLFEKTQLECALQPEISRNGDELSRNQLNLFGY
jgi:hypothetical protein